MANTKVCQGCVEVSRVGKLLLLIYQGLCIYSQTIVQHGQKESEIGMDRKAGEGIWRTEEEVYKRTSVSSIGLRQKK